MKMKQEGKLYVQGFDLRFLDAHTMFPKKLRKLITFDEISLNRENEYFEISDPEFIKYIEQSYFILDYDTFNNMTNEQLNKIVENNEKNINDLKKKQDIAMKHNENMKPYTAAMSNLIHYRENIEKLKYEKNLNKKNGL